MIQDPIKAVEALLNQKLKGFAINEEDGTATLTFERALVIFEGDGLDAYIEVEEIN